MKRISLFLILLVISLSGFSQLISDSIAGKSVDITLKAKYHAIIISLIPDKGSAEAINYINQVRQAQGSNTTYDTSLLVTTTVSYRMVANMYYQIGCQSERLMASDNLAIKNALIPQLYNATYMDLLQVISAITSKNGEETEIIRKTGEYFIMSINP